MLRLIIEKELRDILGSAKFAVTFAVCSVLLLLSFFVAAKNYHTEQARYEAARTQNVRQLEGLTDWINARQVRIFLPPQPLAMLVGGVGNDIGRTVEVQGRGDLPATDSRFSEEPMFALFRFLDLEFMFQVVLSLFAILFAYDAVNGEKERGTLRLTFANPIPRDIFIVGKLTGTALALLIPLLIPMLLGCLLLVLMGMPMSGDDWGRLALITGTGMLYCAAFLALSVAVSALTSRSSSSFLFLLVAWIFAVLIIPRASVLLAGRAVDVPSVDEIASEKARLAAQLWTEDREAMTRFQPAAGGKPEAMMQEFQKFMQTRADERDKKMQELSGRLEETRHNAQAVQERFALGLARCSPSASFSLAASTLAGTSLRLKEEFHNAAVAYQGEFAKFMVGKTGMNPGGSMVIMRMVTDTDTKPKVIDPHELPEFTFRRPSLVEIFPAVLLDVTLLICFNALFFAVAFIAFMRYDLR